MQGGQERNKLLRLLVKVMEDKRVHQREPTALQHLEAIDADYTALRERTREKVQKVLDALSGQDFPSLEARKAIATEIRVALDRVGLRLKCPQCSLPAVLRAVRAGNSRNGVFQFDHPSGGSRTTHKGSSVFPNGLTVTDAPVDRRLK